MPPSGNFRFQVKLGRGGWLSLLLGGVLALAIGIAVVVVAASIFLFLIPLVIVAAGILYLYMLSKAKLRRARRRPAQDAGVIDAEYRVIESVEIEQGDSGDRPPRNRGPH